VVPKTIDDKAVVEFSVLDTGLGMSEKVMARVYEAFYTTKPEGMGIGLKLCRSIVESHHGRLYAENLYNAGAVVGCRFTFWIPVKPLADTAAFALNSVPDNLSSKNSSLS
jgi:signal transduction histidine kinase